MIFFFTRNILFYFILCDRKREQTIYLLVNSPAPHSNCTGPVPGQSQSQKRGNQSRSLAWVARLQLHESALLSPMVCISRDLELEARFGYCTWALHPVAKPPLGSLKAQSRWKIRLLSILLLFKEFKEGDKRRKKFHVQT